MRKEFIIFVVLLSIFFGIGCTSTTNNAVSTPTPVGTSTPTPVETPTPTSVETPTPTSVETPTPTPLTEFDWSGKWDTGKWGVIEFKQSGNSVEGNYSYNQVDYGDIQGYIKGIVSGDKLVGTWYQAPSYNPPDYAGDIEFTMSNDGKSFSGKWRFGSEGNWVGSWDGKRLSI